jgi:predicted enzyme related to lactoylglutathione lyase
MPTGGPSPSSEATLDQGRESGTRRRSLGRQAAGRVGFFLRVDDFDAAHARMRDAGVAFDSPPRDEPYGWVAVFRDIAGNRRDLLGPLD